MQVQGSTETIPVSSSRHRMELHLDIMSFIHHFTNILLQITQHPYCTSELLHQSIMENLAQLHVR